MTRLLASISSVAEAALALAGGADIIDLKDPRQGALGALPLATIRQVVNFVDGRVPVSATIGDLPMQPELLASRVRETAACGVDIVKMGLFGRNGHEACIAALAPIAASGVALVAVLFADDEPDFALLPMLAQAGFLGAMLDTADKKAGRLTDCLPQARLRCFVAAAQQLGLLCGLAGSLRRQDIPALAVLAPDYLGFRGALCVEGNRTAAFDLALMHAIAQMLRECNIRVGAVA